MTFISTYLFIGAVITIVNVLTSDFLERIDVSNFIDILATIIVLMKATVLWPRYVWYGIKNGLIDN